VNVTIANVVSGSAIVTNSVAFTSAGSSAALAGRTALYQTLTAGDTTIFGSSFGTVTVSNVTEGNATNPSENSTVLFVNQLCHDIYCWQILIGPVLVNKVAKEMPLTHVISAPCVIGPSMVMLDQASHMCTAQLALHFSWQW